MISIVTGTLNRISFLDKLIENTVGSSDRLELVLVDGGSTDGTVDHVKELNHPRIKLIEVGGKSSYPHFMNLGIRNSTHELVAQWNDDVLLVNDWEEVFSEIDDHDFYIFSWGMCSSSLVNNSGWNLLDNDNELVMNYGIYSKKVFREIGMYHPDFSFYYADGDMSYRARCFGYSYKSLPDIRVCSMKSLVRSNVTSHKDAITYENMKKLYAEGKLSEGIEYL